MPTGKRRATGSDLQVKVGFKAVSCQASQTKRTPGGPTFHLRSAMLSASSAQSSRSPESGAPSPESSLPDCVSAAVMTIPPSRKRTVTWRPFPRSGWRGVSSRPRDQSRCLPLAFSD